MGILIAFGLGVVTSIIGNYRKRAVKAPCFSCGDETAQKKFAKNKSFLYNFFGFIVHIGLGQRPLQETLLDLNF